MLLVCCCRILLVRFVFVVTTTNHNVLGLDKLDIGLFLHDGPAIFHGNEEILAEESILVVELDHGGVTHGEFTAGRIIIVRETPTTTIGRRRRRSVRMVGGGRHPAGHGHVNFVGHIDVFQQTFQDGCGPTTNGLFQGGNLGLDGGRIARGRSRSRSRLWWSCCCCCLRRILDENDVIVAAIVVILRHRGSTTIDGKEIVVPGSLLGGTTR